jgi:SAM-dependent methyltransferase
MTKEERLLEFTAWCAKHITGDEKGEAQIFLDRLFQAFGQGGIKEAGATLEMRVTKADAGGTAFADLVWKPVVLVEMKKRGTALEKHYRQAFDYWTRLVPGRPRYVVLCNFDEFRVYDFETQMDEPVDSVALADLPSRWGPLAFLAPGAPDPSFGNDRVAVTRQAADALAQLCGRIIGRGVERPLAQRFVLQSLVSFFAEDIGLLPKYSVSKLIEDCGNGRDAFDILGGLFEAMNRPVPATGGRYKDVPYFNGGLFAEPARLELTDTELVRLGQAAEFDWRSVRPEIFGTLFESSLGAAERHAFGAHFTSPVDIMKIVGPTIVAPWHEQVEGAKTAKRLHELLDRLQHFHVLDPACGSGNFLYIAYRELKRVEARIFERIEEFPKAAADGQMPLSFLGAQNFHGMDINPFAVEIAKVTMAIARKLAVDELHVNERPLPLDNLDANFRAADALLAPDGTPAAWPKADVIIGNPPFLGAKRLKPERGPDYVNALRRAYPDVPGMADYCVYWFRRAHDALPPCTAADPLAGRGGLVGTQNVRNNQSRVGGLDHICKTGTIVEAVDNQPWSGEANVHVSIANWVKTQDPALLSKTRRLWSKVDSAAAPKRRRGMGPASKTYELASRECSAISASLSDQTDVSNAGRLPCNFEPQVCFSGQVPGHPGFILSPDDAAAIIGTDARNRDVVHPFLIGRDMLTGRGAPSEWVIDFQTRTMLEASAYEQPFTRLQKHVLPTRQEKAEEGKTADGEQRSHHKQFLRYWWRHSFDRPEMIELLAKMPRYIACSDTTKRPVFDFIASAIRPDHKLRVFAFADDYSFGVLQSHAHWIWFTTKCSKLTERFNYTSSSVFDTFPWPQAPAVARVDAVAAAGREIRRVRAEALVKMKGGLRALYRTLELPGANPLKDAHAALDAAVLTAYGFDPKGDLLAQLLALNQLVAARIESKEPVTSPGLPPGHPDPASLVTADCIRPAK